MIDFCRVTLIKVYEYIDPDHGLPKTTVGHDWVCVSVHTRLWGMLHLERIRRPWCVLTNSYERIALNKNHFSV
jgi:hypothetical protein